MAKYRDWELFDELPEGWVIDEITGSPLSGYDFITNGKSMLNGQKRALLKYHRPTEQIVIVEKEKVEKQEKQEKIGPTQIIDEKYVKTVNDLARKKFEEKLLLDIRTDLIVCEIEGWGKKEYIKELKNLITGIKI